MRVERDLMDPVEVVMVAPAEPSAVFVGPDDVVAAVRREEDRARGLLLRATAEAGRRLASETGVAR